MVLVRYYERYESGKVQFVSSCRVRTWSQQEVIRQMDTVWVKQMQYQKDGIGTILIFLLR